jgi:hypothetical protein
MPDEAVRETLDALVKARIQKKQAQIAHSLRQISAGNPLGSETDTTSSSMNSVRTGH